MYCWPLQAAPLLGDVLVVELAGVDDEAVLEDLLLARLDRPVSLARPRRADAELVVHAPSVGESIVLRVVEDRDVRLILPAGNLHAEVEPHRALPLRLLVAVAGGVEHVGVGILAPRHAQEQAAVVGLGDLDLLALGLALPLQVEDRLPAVVDLHRPGL